MVRRALLLSSVPCPDNKGGLTGRWLAMPDTAVRLADFSPVAQFRQSTNHQHPFLGPALSPRRPRRPARESSARFWRLKLAPEIGFSNYFWRFHNHYFLLAPYDGHDYPVSGSLVPCEDLLPVTLHADNKPAFRLGFVIQRLRKCANLGIRQPLCRSVGILTPSIVVQHQHH